MSLPASIRAYPDCAELFELAAKDPKGARACLGTRDAAIHMRTRMHYFRSLDRQANAEVYPQGDPMHGVSLYDELVVQLKQDNANEWWLYVEPRGSKILAMEGLSDEPPLLEADSTEVLSLTHQPDGDPT